MLSLREAFWRSLDLVYGHQIVAILWVIAFSHSYGLLLIRWPHPCFQILSQFVPTLWHRRAFNYISSLTSDGSSFSTTSPTSLPQCLKQSHCQCHYGP